MEGREIRFSEMKRIIELLCVGGPHDGKKMKVDVNDLMFVSIPRVDYTVAGHLQYDQYQVARHHPFNWEDSNFYLEYIKKKNMERFQKLRCKGGPHEGETMLVDVWMHSTIRRARLNGECKSPQLGEHHPLDLKNAFAGMVLYSTYVVERKDGEFYLKYVPEKEEKHEKKSQV